MVETYIKCELFHCFKSNYNYKLTYGHGKPTFDRKTSQTLPRHLRFQPLEVGSPCTPHYRRTKTPPRRNIGRRVLPWGSPSHYKWFLIGLSCCWEKLRGCWACSRRCFLMGMLHRSWGFPCCWTNWLFLMNLSRFRPKTARSSHFCYRSWYLLMPLKQLELSSLALSRSSYKSRM